MNFLVEKLQKGFLRFNVVRPLLAICESDLIWKNEEWQIKIADLLKSVHEIASTIYEKEYTNWINSRKSGNPHKIRTKIIRSI